LKVTGFCNNPDSFDEVAILLKWIQTRQNLDSFDEIVILPKWKQIKNFFAFNPADILLVFCLFLNK